MFRPDSITLGQSLSLAETIVNSEFLKTPFDRFSAEWQGACDEFKLHLRIEGDPEFEEVDGQKIQFGIKHTDRAIYGVHHSDYALEFALSNRGSSAEVHSKN